MDMDDRMETERSGGGARALKLRYQATYSLRLLPSHTEFLTHFLMSLMDWEQSHLFKPDELGQKIDLPGGLLCARAKLDRWYSAAAACSVLQFKNDIHLS